MSGGAVRHRLGEFARAGFQELSQARSNIYELSETVHTPVPDLLAAFSIAGAPDTALARVNEFVERHPNVLDGLSDREWRNLCLLFGASTGLAEFFIRRPERLRELLASDGRVIGREDAVAEMLGAVGAVGAVGATGVVLGKSGASHGMPVGKDRFGGWRNLAASAISRATCRTHPARSLTGAAGEEPGVF